MSKHTTKGKTKTATGAERLRRVSDRSFPTGEGMVYETVFGIDSHSRSTTVCALDPHTGELTKRTFRDNRYDDIRRFMESFPTPSWGVYEAGCTGYVPARSLTGGDILVTPIAPSKMPVSDDTRNKKNDRNDAVALARNATAGNLTVVWVPDEECEGLRDISQALEDLKSQRTSAYLRVSSLLGRHGHVWNRTTKNGNLKKMWTSEYWAWIRSVRLPDPHAQAALDAAIRAAESAREQYDELERKARELALASSRANVIMALTCLKCVQFVTALAFVAEVGDFSRFSSGRKIDSYLGLVPREEASGDSRRLGGITRSGCTMLRRLPAECSWAATRCGKAAKSCPDGVDARIVERSVTLSKRLADHRRSMGRRGVGPCKANAATAAELARFMLFLGKEAQALEEAKEGEAA